MKERFKKGAASFYIVAFSTLILVIIAASFATIIISEVTRASNDDLSQSAYDAALAGVEDAKLAYANYRRCLAKGATAEEPNGDGVLTCGEIIWFLENPDASGCDMVGLMIGRVSESDWHEAWKNGGVVKGEVFNGEVMVSDTTSKAGDNEESFLNQAYTCAKIDTVLEDYRANLSSSSQTRLVKVEFENAAVMNNIKSIKFSWYDVKEGEKPNWGNFIGNNSSDYKVVFRPVMQTAIAVPPMISLQMIQTGPTFTISSFEQSQGGTTNRATLFFVPTGDSNAAGSNNKIELENSVRSGSSASEATFSGIYVGGRNKVDADQVAKTNDHYIKNLPFLTYCPEGGQDGFYCTVDIDLPSPIGGNRNGNTFMFFVSLPYGEPDTNFAIEFHCDGVCPGNAYLTDSSDTTIARIKGIQIDVDSTGRANDLYRRVETRLETTDTTFAYPTYAVQLFGDDNGVSSATITKDMTVTCEAGVTNCD